MLCLHKGVALSVTNVTLCSRNSFSKRQYSLHQKADLPMVKILHQFYIDLGREGHAIIILDMSSAKQRRIYNLTSSFICWAHTYHVLFSITNEPSLKLSNNSANFWCGSSITKIQQGQVVTSISKFRSDSFSGHLRNLGNKIIHFVKPWSWSSKNLHMFIVTKFIDLMSASLRKAVVW